MRLTLSLLAALLSFGCATLPSTKHQAEVGRVVVVAVPDEPKLSFDGLSGGRIFAERIGHCAAFLFMLVAPPIALTNFGVCATALGVMAAVPPDADELRSTGVEKEPALRAEAMQNALRNQVAAAMRASGVAIAEVRPDPASDAARSRDYRRLAAEGIDAVLETNLARVGTQSAGSMTSLWELADPPLRLYMRTRVRLVRTGDGVELFSREYVYRSGWRKQSVWVADGGRELLLELAAGYQPLGTYISDSVFLIYPFTDQNISVGGIGRFGLEAAGHLVHGASMDSLQPTLEWQRFPREQDLFRSPEEMARVKDVTYELIVARAEHGVPAKIPYRREGLADSKHRLETPLAAGQGYFWTVRARFQLDGRQRVTEWARSYRGSPEEAIAPSLSSYTVLIRKSAE